MGGVSYRLSDTLLCERKDETPVPEGDGTGAGAVVLGWAQLIQAVLIFLPRALDAQQSFVTIFTDSTSYPSNIISEWSLEGGSSLLTSLPTASFFAGSIAGGFLLTPLADSFLGRKNLLLLSCFLTSLSALLTAFFSTSLFLYSALRFASGFSRASIGTCTLVLVSEIIPRRWRSQVAIIGYILFTFGFASLPAIAYFNRNSSWRHIYLWTSLPALLYCVVIHFFVKESPRWLSVQAARCEQQSTNIYSAIRILISRKWTFRRLVLTMVICFGLGIIYYGMPLALGSLSYNLYISTAIEAFMEIPAALSALFLIESVNRKQSLLLTATLSGVFSLICGVVTLSSSAQVAMELVSFLMGTTAFDVALIYVSELFPTSVRNSALAMARQAVLLGGLLGSVLAAVGEAQRDEFIAYGVFGILILVCGAFVVGLPETKGTEICDTMDEEEYKWMEGSSTLPFQP